MKNNAELNIIQSLQQIHPLEKDALDDIKNCIKHRQFPRNTIIQKAGMIASKIYFIEKGIVRHFYKHNKKEVTTWFSQEGEFISNSSFFLQQAGTENIENLEELHVSEINHSDFEQLCKKHHSIEHLVRITMTINFFKLDEHYAQTYIYSATERYNKLIQKYPDFILRIPMIYIASFLGISPETLSRIRAKL